MNVINKICLIIAILQSIFWSWNLGFIGFFELREEATLSDIPMIFLSVLFLFYCIFAIFYLLKNKRNLNINIVCFIIIVAFFRFIPNKTITFEIPTYLILNLFVDTCFFNVLCFFFYDFLYLFAIVWACLNFVTNQRTAF